MVFSEQRKKRLPETILTLADKTDSFLEMCGYAINSLRHPHKTKAFIQILAASTLLTPTVSFAQTESTRSQNQTPLTYETTLGCSYKWTAQASITSEEDVLAVIKSVQIDNQGYYPFWSNSNEKIIARSEYTGTTQGLPPDTGGEYIATGKDIDLFNRFGPADQYWEHFSQWRGNVTVYQSNDGTLVELQSVDISRPERPNCGSATITLSPFECGKDQVIVTLGNTHPSESRDFRYLRNGLEYDVITVGPAQSLRYEIPVSPQEAVTLSFMTPGWGQGFNVNDCVHIMHLPFASR